MKTNQIPAYINKMQSGPLHASKKQSGPYIYKLKAIRSLYTQIKRNRVPTPASTHMLAKDELVGDDVKAHANSGGGEIGREATSSRADELGRRRDRARGEIG
jgi:hypothetical protein